MSNNPDNSLNYDEFIPDLISDSKALLEDIEGDFLALEEGVDKLSSMIDDPKNSENEDILPIYGQLDGLLEKEILSIRNASQSAVTEQPSKALVIQQTKPAVIETEIADRRGMGKRTDRRQSSEGGDRRKSGRRGGEPTQETIRVNVGLLNNLMTMAGTI